MGISVDDLQRVLGSHRKAEGETEDALVRRRAAAFAPAFWQLLDRADYGRAVAEAIRRGETRETIRALALPFWLARNEDEVDRDDEWRAVLLVVPESSHDVLIEIDLTSDVAPCVRAEITVVRRSFVVPMRAYATSPARAARFGRFSVIESTLGVIVDRVIDGAEVRLTPSPTRVVPAFSMQYEPAFEGGPLLADARRIAEALSFDGSSD